jgi:hypothetical protein
MAKERGFAVISGSSTVVARIMENGTVIFGQDMAATGSYSGTLVLNLPSGYGDGRVVHVNSVGSASLSQLSASSVAVSSSLANLSSSTNVQSALDSLQNQIDSVGASANLDLSDGTNTGSIVFATDLLKVTGTANEVDVAFAKSGVTGTLTVGLPSDVVVTNSLTANTLTASNGLLVSAGGATVTGNISGSGNLQAGGTLTVAGNTTLNGGTNTVNGNLQVNGNLIVTGSTVTLDVQNLRVEDPIIVLGSGSGALVDGDRGIVMTQSGSANLAFGWDDSDQVFRIGTTADDGTTQSLTITPSGTLELGGLKVTNAVVFQGGLTVTGAVNLPAASIDNTELVNSSINISGGVGISVSGLESISLGGSGSIALNLSELSSVTVVVGEDSLAIVDASNASASALTTVASLSTGMAGTGLTATNGVLSVNYGSTSGTAVSGSTTLTVSGTANEVEVGGAGNLFQTVTLGAPSTITIGLPDSVTIGNLTLTGSLVVSGSTTLGTGTEDTITVVGNLRNPIFTVSGANAVAGFPTVPASYITNASQFSGYSFYLTSSAAANANGVTPGSGSWGQANKWYFNESGEWFASFFIAVP